jgi:hypothetical protein
MSFLKGIETRLTGRLLCSPVIIANELICLHFNPVLLKLKPMLKYGLYFEFIRLKTAFLKKMHVLQLKAFCLGMYCNLRILKRIATRFQLCPLSRLLMGKRP